MTILKDLPNQKGNGDYFGDVNQKPQNATTDGCPLSTKRVTVIDGMA